MTRRILEEEPGEVDIFPTEMDTCWEDVLGEIDSLFQYLQASQHVRGVVLLRMRGHSVNQIADQLRIGVEDVRSRLADAGRLLIQAGVLEAELAGDIPPLPGSDNADSPLVSGLLTPGQFRRRRQSIWRQAPPPPKRRLRLTKGPLTIPPSEARGAMTSTHPPALRSRPLTPVQSFGWRDVYYSEVHRYGLKR